MSLLGGYWGKIKVLNAFESTVRRNAPPDVAKRLLALRRKFGIDTAEEAKDWLIENFGHSNLTKEAHTVAYFMALKEICIIEDGTLDLHLYLDMILAAYATEHAAVLPSPIVEFVNKRLSGYLG